LLAGADALAVAALDRIDAANAAHAGGVAGLVEQHARLAGAEEAVALTVSLVIDGIPWIGAAPAVLSDPLGARSLAIQPNFRYQHWQ
jgi:hypothetical protein